MNADLIGDDCRTCFPQACDCADERQDGDCCAAFTQGFDCACRGDF